MLELKTIIAILEGKTLVPISRIIIIDVNSLDQYAMIWISGTLQNQNCPKRLTLIFQANAANPMPDSYFQLIINPQVMRAYPEKLNLTFRYASINSDIILSLLKHKHCPRGLSLHLTNCRDIFNDAPLNLCINTHAKFAAALKTNYAIISFDIRNDADFAQDNNMTQQNRKTTTPSYNNLVWQFHKVTRRNRVIFNLLQLVREKNDKALKGFLNQPEAFEDMLELLRENPSPRTEELYLYLKAYMHFSNMQLAQVWKILTESMLAKSSSLIYQRKIKALLAVLLDAYADRHSNDSYANKEAFERARCQYTLWLFCNDDFRSDEKMYATIISCLQQLRGKSVNSHETLHEIIGRKCNLLISYAELCEIVFGRKSNSTLEFNASVVKYLDDPIVQCKLITKYNTCQVAVLEHLICENSRLPLKATIKQAEQTLKSVICSEISASQTDETQATNTISVAALAAR